MTLSNAEQYLLELMNRARLDPGAEAARFGIDLNKDLAPGTLTATAKQVLAPNALLETAATLHSQWMLAQDIFSHTGEGGSDPGQRITAQGYVWQTYGENIAFVGTTGSIVLETAIAQINQNLFLSAGHRENLMNGAFREVGLGAETGVFTSAGTDYNAEMVTEDFGTSGTARFLTGVAYSDANHDAFYSIGEGQAGVTFTAGGFSAQTQAAGGYALAAGTASATAVTGSAGGLAFSLTVDMSLGNVKLDLVGGTQFFSSGSLTLGTGVNDARLLGIGVVRATGNAAGNHLTGNAGANVLAGMSGADVLSGEGGNDRLSGGGGADQMQGGLGNDTLRGDAGNDVLTGNAGADVFVFTKGGGIDQITDFSLTEHDRLQLDHLLWTGTQTAAEVISHFATVGSGEVLFSFGSATLHLAGVMTLIGLEAQIQLI